MMSELGLEGQGRIRHRLGALSMSMLLPSLGTSIVNVALPSLATSFEATMAEVQWLVICYLLAVTSLIVSAGRLGDLIGRRRLLLIGIALFALASVAGALAPNLWVLIGARSVQGVGAAVMMALTVAMVGDSVPEDRRGSAMGLMGTLSAVGTALGPLVGGVLIVAFGWPAVFAVLAIMGVGALLIGRAMLPVDAKPVQRTTGFDGTGTVLMAVSLVAFTGMLTFGARLSAPAFLAIAALTVLGFSTFVRHQARTPSPLVRLDLLRDRELRAGLISLALVSAILMATLVVGPFYLSDVLGLESFGTGLVMSVGPVVAALTGAPAGRLVDRAGSFRVMAGGLIAVTAGSALMTVLPMPFGVGGYVAGLVVITSGYALFQAANTTAIMQRATSDRRGVTSALLGLSRNIGLISGASAMGTVYASGPLIAGGLGLRSGEQAGLQITFVTAMGLAGLALGVSLWRRRPQVQLPA